MRIPSTLLAIFLTLGLLAPVGAQTNGQATVAVPRRTARKVVKTPPKSTADKPAKEKSQAGKRVSGVKIRDPRLSSGHDSGKKSDDVGQSSGGSDSGGKKTGGKKTGGKNSGEKYPGKDQGGRGDGMKPPRETPDKGGDDVSDSPQDGGHHGDDHGNDRPPKRRWPDWHVVVRPTYPSRDHADDRADEESDEKRDEESEEAEESEQKKPKVKKSDKKKDDEVADEVADEIATPLTGGAAAPAVAEAPEGSIPRYDCPTFRRLMDAMFAAGHVDSGLAILELMKEKEYFLYTGSLLMLDTAQAAPGPLGDYDVRYASDTQKQKGSKKDKSAKKSKKKDDDEGGATPTATAPATSSAYAQGDWRGPFEEYADRVLALSTELSALEADKAALSTPAGKARLGELRNELAKATDAVDTLVGALSDKFGRKDPRVRRLKSSEALMDGLAQLPNTVGIYTVSAPTRLWLILVTPTSRRIFNHPTPSAELSARVTALATALRDKTANPIPAARALYTPLFGPIEAELKALNAETLLWSLDGALRYVPIAALHDGSRYVVESYGTAVLSRAGISKLTEETTRPWSGVGLGVSQKIGQFAALPSVADELDGIFGASGDQDPVRGEVLLDASFTEAAFASAVRGAPPVVHVATHFQLVPGKADDSMLLLGDGSLMTVGDIRSMKDAFKGIELLALSACETAVPANEDGREVECFATIAQNRGARAVLASLWPVNDRSTSSLMQAFYRVREAGADLSKAQSLREAQRKLLSGEVKGTPTGAPDRALVHGQAKGAGTFVKDPNAPFAHPYYWASFIVMGNPR